MIEIILVQTCHIKWSDILLSIKGNTLFVFNNKKLTMSGIQYISQHYLTGSFNINKAHFDRKIFSADLLGKHFVNLQDSHLSQINTENIPMSTINV